MVDSHVLIFLGSDEDEKLKRIEHLQKKLFPPALKDLNFTLLYGDDKEFSEEGLQDALTCFPTEGAQQRLVVIKRAHKLKKNNLVFLNELLEKPLLRTVLVLDIPEARETKDLVESLVQKGAQVVRFKTEKTLDAFDLCRAIVQHRPEDALKILAGLLRGRSPQTKILGAIFWQWERSYVQRQFSQDAYQKGLRAILEADKRLKSSSSAFARETLILEALVVKLSYLSR